MAPSTHGLIVALVCALAFTASAESNTELFTEGIQEFRMGGRTLVIDRTRKHARLMDREGAVLHFFGDLEIVRDFKVSDSGSCLLLLVHVQRPMTVDRSGTGYSYGYLLRIATGPDGRDKVSRHLDTSLPPMNRLHRWVSALVSVSDDGKTAVLRFGEANQEATPYRMSYSLQSWDIETAKALSTLDEGDTVRRP